MIAALTAEGLDRLRNASRTHLAGIARHFVARYSAADLIRLAELCTRLAESQQS